MGPLRVMLRGHAFDRAIERLGLPAAEAARVVKAEVRAALLDGRVADRPPSWLEESLGYRPAPRLQPRRRVCWNVARDRAYVIDVPRDGVGVAVITVLGPVDAEAAA